VFLTVQRISGRTRDTREIVFVLGGMIEEPCGGGFTRLVKPKDKKKPGFPLAVP
jgi:hypothetical protein